MNYNKKTVQDVDVRGKKVLLRCDFNVPQDKETGAITSDKRIVAALPTIRYLLDNGAAVIACSHLGKPKGEWKPELSLKVYDAARPMHIQQKMWNVVAGTPKNIYVSNPKNGGGLHNYGMAVDLTLCDAKGDTLSMGTKIDYLGKLAHIDNEAEMVKQGKLTPEARSNRELLRRVMRQAGFKALRTEWWHFNFITRAEAKAHYKPIP